MNTKFFSIAAIISSLWVLCCPAQVDEGSTDVGKPAGAKNVVVLRDVEIGSGGVRPLHADLTYPAVAPGKPMPAVIWIHGGAWYKGTHKINGARLLADHGYFTMSVEYRLTGEAGWPAQIEDCKLAVRWLRANAAKYHVNPDKIGVWGSSAGGHLAACLGTMGDQAQFEGKGGYGEFSSKVQAVVDYFGPVDFTAGSDGIQNSKDNESPGLVALFGGGFAEKAELWKEGSPITYVDSGDPPFFIAHGDNDRAVPIRQSEKMTAALTKAGVPVEFVVVKGAGHGMIGPKGGPAPVPDPETLRAMVQAFFDKTLK